MSRRFKIEPINRVVIKIIKNEIEKYKENNRRKDIQRNHDFELIYNENENRNVDQNGFVNQNINLFDL